MCIVLGMDKRKALFFLICILGLLSSTVYGAGISDFEFSIVDKVDEETLSIMARAKSGDAESQYIIGRLFCCSKSVKYDPIKSAFWVGRAAGQGHVEAQFRVGYIHSIGSGVKKDKRKALLWYSRAADKGHAGALFRLGEMYFKGDGVKKNDQKAIEYLSKSAEQGNRGAIRLLSEVEK